MNHISRRQFIKWSLASVMLPQLSMLFTTKSKYCIYYKAMIRYIFIDAHSYLGDKNNEYITEVIQSAKDIGVTHVILANMDWKNIGDFNLAIKTANIIRSVVGLGVVIPSQGMTKYSSQVAQYNGVNWAPYSTYVLIGIADDAQDYRNWSNENVVLIQSLAETFNPDGWYIELELCTTDPAWPIGGNFPNLITESINKVTDKMMVHKPADVWMSPYWGGGSNTWGQRVWDDCLKNLSKAPLPFKSISAIQDRVGTFGIDLKSRLYKDAISKMKWHKSVCESNGWLATVNPELFAPDSGHPTWERVKGQFDAEARSDIVSNELIVDGDIGIGPCWEYSNFLAPQVPESLDLYIAYKKYREIE